MSEELPDEIAADLGELLRQLRVLEIHPVHSEYAADSFGNYLVDFRKPTLSFRIIRDCSQYMVEGNQDELRAAGLWRAFEDKQDLENAVLSWLRRA